MDFASKNKIEYITAYLALGLEITTPQIIRAVQLACVYNVECARYLKGVREGIFNIISIPWRYRSRALCVSAVAQDVYAINNVPDAHLDYKMYSLYIRAHMGTLHNVPADVLTTDLCMTSVKNCGYNLKFVPPQFITREMCLAAVRNMGIALEFVPHEFKDVEICLAALNQDPDAREFIADSILTLFKN